MDGGRERVLEVHRGETGFVCRFEGVSTWWGPFQTLKLALYYVNRKLGRNREWLIKWEIVEETA